VLRRPVESALAAAVRVVHELAGGRPPEVHGHLQGVQDEVGAQVRGGLPADDHAREDVLDERQVHESLARL
jgi:hypothetical protein